MLFAQVLKNKSKTLSDFCDRDSTQSFGDVVSIQWDLYHYAISFIESSLPEEILTAWEPTRQRKESVAYTKSLEICFIFSEMIFKNNTVFNWQVIFSATDAGGSVPKQSAFMQKT